MTDDSKSKPDLAQILVDQNIISAAQVQLALADKEVTGMPLEEILIVRGWITQDTLDRVAPWLKNQTEEPTVARFQTGQRTYDNSLKEYKRLMERILGTPWDY
jgi:hypothetical protein